MGKIDQSISFFFPAFNDAGTVELLVQDGLRVLPTLTDDFEIIIVNDGSFDETAEIADRCAATYENVRVIHHPVNLGYGAALRTGFDAATKDLVFYTDGDRQFDVNELPKLVEQIAGAGIVTGYRIARAEGQNRRASSAIYNFVTKKLFGLEVRDVDCAFKLIRREVLQHITLSLNGDFICAELFYGARQRGYKVRQVPVHHYSRTYGVSMAYSWFGIGRSLIEFTFLLWELRGRQRVLRARQSVLRHEFESYRRGHPERFNTNAPVESERGKEPRPATDQLDPADG